MLELRVGEIVCIDAEHHEFNRCVVEVTKEIANGIFEGIEFGMGRRVYFRAGDVAPF